MGRRVAKGRGKVYTNDRGQQFRVGTVVRSQIIDSSAPRGEKGIIRKIGERVGDQIYAEVVYSQMGRTRSLASTPDYASNYSPERLASEQERNRGKGYVQNESINYLAPVGQAKRVPTLKTAKLPEYGKSESGVWAGRAGHGVRPPKRVRTGGRLIANLGDRDPFSYGGFLIFKEGKGHNAVYWETSDSGDGGDNENVQVYRFDIPNDVFKDQSWAKPEEIASSVGMDSDELEKLGKSKKVIDRAGVMRDIGSHWGFDNLDSYPISLTIKELKSRYSRAVSGLYKRKGA